MYCFWNTISYLDDTNWFPGQVETGVEQEGQDEGESSVPAGRAHRKAALRTEGAHNMDLRFEMSIIMSHLHYLRYSGLQKRGFGFQGNYN